MPNPAASDDVTSWQEAVAKEMEQKHVEEREFLINVRSNEEEGCVIMEY